MPAARYQPFWSRMPAFAFPSYYDGQIRLNLAGRERHGIVPVWNFEVERDRIVAALQEIHCLETGESSGTNSLRYLPHLAGEDPVYGGDIAGYRDILARNWRVHVGQACRMWRHCTNS